MSEKGLLRKMNPLGDPVDAAKVVTGDDGVTRAMDANAEKASGEPIMDAIRSTRNWLKHTLWDMPITWSKNTISTARDIVAAPALKVLQIATSTKSLIHTTLGAGMLTVEKTLGNAIGHASTGVKRIKGPGFAGAAA